MSFPIFSVIPAHAGISSLKNTRFQTSWNDGERKYEIPAFTGNYKELLQHNEEMYLCFILNTKIAQCHTNNKKTISILFRNGLENQLNYNNLPYHYKLL